MNALAVIALSKRLRTLIARGSHRSELLETCDLLDVAIESPDTKTPAPPPALTPSLPPDPPPESKSEPSQPMQSDGGAGASLPSGWRVCRPCNCTMLCYGPDHLNSPVVWRIRTGAYGWTRIGGDGAEGEAPTLLQAMCAALGIEIRRAYPFFVAVTTGDVMKALVSRMDASASREACARLALERHHAQQSAPAVRAEADELRKAARELTAPMRAQIDPVLRAFEADGIVASAPPNQQRDRHFDDVGSTLFAPDCKCWPLSGGRRQVNRWCSLHAAEWQTFAEQSAGELDPRERGARVRTLLGSWRAEDEALGTHPDGTSRAGCDVCEGGKR
jgi:hypothetical protein